MTFAITSSYHHRAVRVTWRHGYFSGDTELIAEGQPVGPPGGP